MAQLVQILSEANALEYSILVAVITYVPFVPSHSEEHLPPHPPQSYRDCWHGVSWGFFLKSFHDHALDERALQAALSFLTHVILLDRDN
ncbi:hypothetical protein KY285_024148 [Solanum tuberosum]|nr:hypothetical protein KY289_026084 [Solanum tuberosum]KAH0676347.1 hypothetical protein KY285_024148 [Solanum tuberosum]